MNIPPCAKWGIWTGPEVEGQDQLGVTTLFIRSTHGHTLSSTIAKVIANRGGKDFYRYWICKEYITPINVVETVLDIWAQSPKATVAFEVADRRSYEYVADARRMLFSGMRLGEISIYLKLDWVSYSETCDYICVGPAFGDKAIKMEGSLVKPDDYLRDICYDHLFLPVDAKLNV